ncbi:hypothetical protein CU097_002751 [Rhizopus azygosporus]|uniref:HTH APSES-type domain-containing protein n=1 Tax=Rhizopus azygosporus TaxID=86630 RepID=A0A367ITG5_RHIAZ|nr:hypothetical protein CU097_002751 [Rhizopus azygosporus]
MEGLYQTLPYPYLPQAPPTDYSNPTANHSGSPASTPLMMYRPTLERPVDPLDNHPPPSPPSTLHWPHPYHHHHHYHHHTSPSSSPYGCYGSTNSVVMASSSPTRPKVSTNIWEDEGTLCFQVDAKGICVARRQDNDMINGTKLLNVVGMSRGKRDGILKNEKGRVVVKVGAMHLKGVWIPFQRARELATKFKIIDLLYPLFADDPSIFLCNNPLPHNDLSTDKSKMIVNTFHPQQQQQQQHRLSIDYNAWNNKPSHYLPHHYPQVIHRNNELSSNSSPPKLMTQPTNPSEEHNNHDVYDPSPYDYRPSHGRSSISSLSSHQSTYLYPHDNNSNRHTEEEKLPLESFYGCDKERDGPTTPSSWYSPETPTAVLYQQKKRKSSLSSDELSQKVSPYSRVTKKTRVAQE